MVFDNALHQLTRLESDCAETEELMMKLDGDLGEAEARLQTAAGLLEVLQALKAYAPDWEWAQQAIDAWERVQPANSHSDA